MTQTTTTLPFETTVARDLTLYGVTRVDEKKVWSPDRSVFELLHQLAAPEVKDYQGDFYADAGWIHRHVPCSPDLDMEFFYSWNETGTAIGTRPEEALYRLLHSGGRGVRVKIRATGESTLGAHSITIDELARNIDDDRLKV